MNKLKEAVQAVTIGAVMIAGCGRNSIGFCIKKYKLGIQGAYFRVMIVA